LKHYTDQRFSIDIIDNISEAVIILDPDRNICAANTKALEKFPAINGENPQNARCYELLFAAKDECINCPVKSAIRSKRNATNIITPIEGVFWLIKADPIFEDGEVAYVIKRMEKISGRTDIEKKLSMLNKDLQRSNQDLEQFAYAVSHDLREPLRMIASYLQLLDMENHDKFSAESKEFMAIAFDGAKRMNALLDGLLQYSRVGARGKVPVECDCEEIIANATTNLMLQIDETNTKIKTSNLPKKMPADKSQLIQLFSNLISNSIKYARTGVAPEIEISCIEDASNLQFCLGDNGMGIEKQYFDKIFQVFQRLHGRNDIPGYGLGLSICKRIVERHGGEIWVESNEGQGTKFFFTIPKEAAAKPNEYILSDED
jgi:signal transduction histidine kinase